MLIVKPYGRSETEPDGAGGLRRKIRRNRRGRPAGDLTDAAALAAGHPELVLAQWISAIDKIAAKPRGARKPTPEQRRLRETLGRAAFDLLTAEGLLDPSLEGLWKRKLHPYGEGDDRKAHGREKGRWYARFAGGREPDAIDGEAAGEIARKIREHLHRAGYRIGGGRPDRRQGLIAARAGSIAAGVPPLPERLPDGERPWSEGDRKEYAAAGDVAAAIRAKAEEREGRKLRFSMRDAAPVLYEQYGRLFRGDGGRVLPVAEARAAHPGLFALRGAVKDAYAGILKKHRKRSVAGVLPEDMDSLFRLVERKSGNRDLAALLRLGKAIHYAAASGPGADAPANAVDDWPGAAEPRRYLTSKKQSEIKRNEAFVRVWRNTVALAARTAMGWADPDQVGRDVLAKGSIDAATGDLFDDDAFLDKLPLLFGDRAELFEGGDDFRRSVLRLALEGWAELRNSSFHFKGRSGFIRALRRGPQGENATATAAAHRLLERDRAGRRARLLDELRAAHVEHYLDQVKLRALAGAVLDGAPPKSPMPRFRRVLDRAEKAWGRRPHRLRLPPPGNRAELEKPGRLCRYTAVKMLYERAFPAWLEDRDHAALNAWIERAAKRATEEARKIHKDEYAVARAETRAISLDAGQGIADFSDRLSAATATELRVQRGYGCDAEQAREQAKYIDDLRCDVVAQAFADWLAEAGFAWAPEDLGDGPRPEEKRSDLEAAAPPAADPHGGGAADWEAALYFLLQLAPVDAVNRLQHQLRKWSILEGKPDDDAEAVGRLFDLHIDMHDARFEGGEGMMAGVEALKPVFDGEETFSRACPEQPGKDDGRYVPLRGLREILRFGGNRPLMPVFKKHPITAGDVDDLDAFEKKDGDDSPIARQQKEREDLHAKWVEEKKKFSAGDKDAYHAALADVARHRRLAAHVRLVNHARLHRLLMAVLGRLVDYAGLWERDLYFATLALLRLSNRSPEEFFGDDEALGHLKDGRIVAALQRLKRSSGKDEPALLGQLQRLFGDEFLDGSSGSAAIRNKLAHFDMLRGGKGGAGRLDLTEAVNETRRLMAYDRKLKNAVSKSVIELMARENLDLAWTMEGHRLAGATVKARQAVHLEDRKIREDLHGDQFVAMAADLFAGKALPSEGAATTARHVGGKEAGVGKRGKPGGKWPPRAGSRRRRK